MKFEKENFYEGLLARLINCNLVITRNAAVAAALLATAAVPYAGAEPRKVVFENERVKVWDITLAPGESSFTGSKVHDTISICLAGGKLETTAPDGRKSIVTRKVADAVYKRRGMEATIKDISDVPVHLIVAELKEDKATPVNANTSGYGPSFPRPGSEKLMENDRVIVWTYPYKPGVPTPMHFHDKDSLVVYRYDGTVKSTTPQGEATTNEDKAGTVRFTKGNRVHVEELVNGKESVIVTELK